ncbi:hypothetical protein V8E36_009634 [Tilletia maclaganii]
MGSRVVAENVFGTISTILWSLQLIPQIIKSYRKKSTEGLSAWLLVIWLLGTAFQGTYILVQRLNIPLAVQPQLFAALAIVTLAQCWFYAHNVSRYRCILLGALLAVLVGGSELGFYFMCKRIPGDGSREAATKAMGLLGAILFTAGLIPQYAEIWKLKEVRGISFIFLLVDISGGVFAIISLALKDYFDYIGALNYIGIVIAESGIFLLACILNPRARKRRQRAEGERQQGAALTSERDSANEIAEAIPGPVAAMRDSTAELA